MHGENRRASPEATVLGCVLVAFGVLGTIAAGLSLLVHGVLPALSQHDSGAHAELARGAAVLYLQLLLAVVPVLGGALLLARHPAARAWIVCGALVALAGVATTGGASVTDAWRDLQASRGIASAAGPALAIATTLVWVLSLVVVIGRGRRWLPKTSASQWGLAAASVGVVIVGLYALHRDPGRDRAPYEKVAADSCPEGGTGRLVIVPVFDGHPLKADVEAPARLTLDDQKTKASRNVDARLAAGEIAVDVSGGLYGIRLGIDLNRDNGTGPGWGMPGDLVSDSARLDVVRDGATIRRQVQMVQILGLRQPEDTTNGVSRTGESLPQLRSPVTFAWDAVPDAGTYGFSVSRRSSGADTFIAGTKRPVTTWTVELPASGAGESYSFHLAAYGETGSIGRFEVQGDGWRGSDYRFRVVNEAQPTPTGHDTPVPPSPQ